MSTGLRGQRDTARRGCQSDGNIYLLLAIALGGLALFMLLLPMGPSIELREPRTPAPHEKIVPPPYTSPPRITPVAPVDAEPIPPTSRPPQPRGVDPDLDGDLELEDDHHHRPITEQPAEEPDEDRGRIGDGDIDIWRWLT